MTKTREFWVIVGITAFIPILMIGVLFYGLIIHSPSESLKDPVGKLTVVNKTHVTYIVTNKYMYDDRMGVGTNIYDYNIPNKSEFDQLEFKKQYTCNLTTKGWLINVTHSISDCKENTEFNYTKLFKHGE